MIKSDSVAYADPTFFLDRLWHLTLSLAVQAELHKDLPRTASNRLSRDVQQALAFSQSPIVLGKRKSGLSFQEICCQGFGKSGSRQGQDAATSTQNAGYAHPLDTH